VGAVLVDSCPAGPAFRVPSRGSGAGRAWREKSARAALDCTGTCCSSAPGLRRLAAARCFWPAPAPPPRFAASESASEEGLRKRSPRRAPGPAGNCACRSATACLQRSRSHIETRCGKKASACLRRLRRSGRRAQQAIIGRSRTISRPPRRQSRGPAEGQAIGPYLLPLLGLGFRR
jgi:hypothetical protein